MQSASWPRGTASRGAALSQRFLARADRLGEPVLIEFGRLRLPPPICCRGVREEPPLELDAVLGAVFAGLEFVQGDFGAVDEDFVVADRGVEDRDEFEEVGEEIGILHGQSAELSRNVCLASSSWLKRAAWSRHEYLQAAQARRDALAIAAARFLAGCWKFKWGGGNLQSGAPSGPFAIAGTHKSSLLRTASARSAYHSIATG
jgi:hypothetical protein